VSDDISTRIAEARVLLKDFGFDRAQCNVRSARVLVSLLGMTPSTLWSAASPQVFRTFEIMAWISEHWGFTYAANSRETIRRQTLHQFVAAGFAAHNADAPGTAINSSLNNYRITDEALAVIRLYGTDSYESALADYLEDSPGLAVLYRAARDAARIPVTLPGGQELTLSAGGQNVLIDAMIRDFCALFIPGGEVLYIGDADEKFVHFAEVQLLALGVTVDQHGKFPDLVVYQPEKDWLFLMEAATTHGPVDAKRHAELSAVFARCTAGLVYVSCFPDRATMRRFLADLAWETEVWLADEPTHMMHLNGERLLGPYQ